MLTMPFAGKLTDRYGPTWLPATGLPLVAIGLIPFAFVGPQTSYVLLCAVQFVQGLGMGLAMMPNMTAAMQAVPPAAIARTSTAMNIIRQIRRLDRHRDPQCHPRLGDHQQPERDCRHAHLRLGLGRARHPPAPARQRARRGPGAVVRRVCVDVRVGAAAHRRRPHPRGGDGDLGLPQAARRPGRREPACAGMRGRSCGRSPTPAAFTSSHTGSTPTSSPRAARLSRLDPSLPPATPPELFTRMAAWRAAH